MLAVFSLYIIIRNSNAISTCSKMTNFGLPWISTFLIPVLLFLAAECAFAVGTTSGTVIQNSATIQASNATPATSNVHATSVVSVYGIAVNTEPADGSATAGGIAYYKIKFTNLSLIHI